MSELDRAITSEIEKDADMLIKMCYSAEPGLRRAAHRKLRSRIESLDFFSAPKERVADYLSAYNVLSVFLFNPEELAEKCLNLFLLPEELSRDLKTVDDEMVKKRRLFGYILNESYLSLAEEKPTISITINDAHYLKLVQSISQIDLAVARGYVDNYNHLSRTKIKAKKIKKIVPIKAKPNFGLVIE